MQPWTRLKKRLWHRRFPSNCAKVLTTVFTKLLRATASVLFYVLVYFRPLLTFVLPRRTVKTLKELNTATNWKSLKPRQLVSIKYDWHRYVVWLLFWRSSCFLCRYDNSCRQKVILCTFLCYFVSKFLCYVSWARSLGINWPSF